MIWIIFVGRSFCSPAPTSTPSKEVTINANAEPRKTIIGDLPELAKAITDSWVLSPSSAKNIETKVIISNFQSILPPVYVLVKHSNWK